MDRRSLDHRLSTESIDMKISFFILVQIKLIFTKIVLHLVQFWKWEFLDLDVRSSQKTGFFRFPQSIGSICFYVECSRLNSKNYSFQPE